MCQFFCEANEPMEPTDELIGPDSEEYVGSSASHAVNPEQETIEKEDFSSYEVRLMRPSIPLGSIDSIASSYSDFSVDVNPNDGHIPVEGGFQSVQDDPINGLSDGHLSKSSSVISVGAIEQSDYLKESHTEGKIGFGYGNLDLRSTSFKSTYDDHDSSGNDEPFDEADEPLLTLDGKELIWVPPEAANKDNEPDHSVATWDDDDDECVDSDGTEWTKSNWLNGDEDGVSVSGRIKEEKQKAIEEVRNGRFKTLVSQLLKKVRVENFDEKEGSWVDVVTRLAWQAAFQIKPDATEAKSMDPAGYVKIKCIASGSRTESQLIKGLVFKKHAAHKHMATKYKNPRILLIQGVLDQSSGSSGLSSFNSMISQGKDNLAVLLDNLEICHPNVILVEKSASRDVIEGVLKMGVTLVHDMKLNRLERVARCIGSPILSSETIFSQKLSHCDSVYFEKFVEDHMVGEGGKKPSKTLMFLEGCPKRLGCTILLKGSNSEELKKIKCVVQCAVVMAYHFIMDTSFLVDQKAMFSTFTFGTEAGVSLTDGQSSSVVFEPPNYTPYGEELSGGSDLAYGVQILITDGDDDGSSHIQASSPKVASSFVLDIPISNGFHEEESIHAEERAAKATEVATSNGFHGKVTDNMVVSGVPTTSNEAHMATLFRSLPSIPDAVEKDSIISPTTSRQMSSFVDLHENQPVSESAASVLPSEEALDKSNTEATGCEQDELLYSHLQTLSSFPAAADDATEVVNDGEDCNRPMDEINSVLDSESILVLMSSRNALKGTICEQSHFSHIKFYRNFDVPLGKFLLDILFNQSFQCKECDDLPEAHFYYYAHHSKQLTIRVKQRGNEWHLPGESEGKIWMWSRCGKCDPNKKASTKRVLISTAGRGLSFGKFLELSFSNHSCFNRISSCRHSFQKDFLYFFGLGSMVAMFQYSRVARYKVSLPAQKLEFSCSSNRDWLQREIDSVYTKGLLLFTEIFNYLKKIEPRFSDSDLVLNDSSKGFSDIVALLMLERSEFEENIKSIGIKNENFDVCVYIPLSLNQLRWEILLESCIWNQRLQFLRNLSSSLPRTTTAYGMAQRQMNLEENGDEGARGEEHHTTTEKVDHEPIEGTTAPADKTVDTQEDDRSGILVECVQSTAVSGQHDAIVECVECIPQGDHNASENCCDGEVQIEGISGADNLDGSGEQVLMSSPVFEEPRPTPVDSISSVSLLQESLRSPNLPPGIQSISENSQADSVQEPRSMSFIESTYSDEVHASERLAFTPSSNLENSRGWIWYPLAQIREKCKMDLGKENIVDLLPKVSDVVNEEGTRLHIPVNDGDYIVSDYDGEISSSIACALAAMKDQTPPEFNMDENIALKRATSEPSPNLSLKPYDSEVFRSAPSMSFTGSRFSSFDGLNWLDSMVDYGQIHPEVTLGIDKYSLKGKYSVVIMYADKFRALRKRCCPSELDYIASLSRCKIWDAKGGKSKSFFAKTLDDRLIIKEIKKTEFESFMKFSLSYFNHMNQSFELGNQTCLAKILGIYQVTIRHAKSGRETKHDLMVQENLSFGRNITRQYDLKGALHARFTATADGTGDVLLDQNFVNDMNSSPLYIGQKAKRLLQRAVWNDTTFLNSINVMDYSLLVGVDRQRKELVCGIIDYLRQFTWDKQLETWVKSSLVPKNVLPTIISPKEYKKRFRKFMDTHFLTVPDHWCSQRSSNPCKLCGIKGGDDSSIVKSLAKQEEELSGPNAQE